jgi:hypothetical protein
MTAILGQRDLFTKRVRKPLPAPEFHLQVLVADVLRRWAMPGWRWTHLPLGEERPSQIIKGKRVSLAGARLKRAGVNPGWPDFILLSPTALAHFLELKRRGEDLSDTQEDFADWCSEHQAPFVSTHDFKVALKTLQGWGAVRGSVHA